MASLLRPAAVAPLIAHLPPVAGGRPPAALGSAALAAGAERAVEAPIPPRKDARPAA